MLCASKRGLPRLGYLFCLGFWSIRWNLVRDRLVSQISEIDLIIESVTEDLAQPSIAFGEGTLADAS